MRQTPNYNLPQFEGADFFNKEALNDAFTKIDTGISDIQDSINVLEPTAIKYVKDLNIGINKSEELISKNEKLVADGGLVTQVEKKDILLQVDAKAKQLDLEVEKKRIDLLSKVESGQTVGNTELLDIRIGANGKEYSTSGNAIREQFNIIDEKIRKFQNGFDYNLLNEDKDSETHYGITFTKLTSGGYSVSGTSTVNLWFDFGFVDLTGINNDENLTLSGSVNNIIIYGYFRTDRTSSSSLGSISSIGGVSKVFNKNLSSQPNNCKCITFSLYVASGTTLNNVVVKPMVNKGKGAVSYLKYGTATPVKDYLDNKYSNIDSLYALDDFVATLDWTNGKCLNLNGQSITYADCSHSTEFIPISNLLLKSTITNLYDRVSWTVVGLCFYDETKAFIGKYSPSTEGNFNIKIADIISNYIGAKYIKINKLTTSEVKFLKGKQEEIPIEDNVVANDESYKLNMYENILICGDSTTEGFVVDSNIYQVETKYAYPTQLKKIIPQWNITTKAKSGASAVSWRNMFYSTIDFSQYDLIIMELGYNGADAGYFNMEDINTVGRNTYEYKKLIADIRSQNPTAEIILVLSSKYTNSGDKWDWKPILELVAGENNCKIINLRDKTYLDLNLNKYHGIGNGVMDYVHFNRIGYNAKAYVVSRLITNLY